MNAHGYEFVRRWPARQLRADGANEIGASAVNAERQELVGGDIVVAEIVQIFDELGGDILGGERQKLIDGQARVAQAFHALHKFGAGSEAEAAVALTGAEGTLECQGAGFPAQFEMGGTVGCRDVAVEAIELARFVAVSPSVIVPPIGGAHFQIESAV